MANTYNVNFAKILRIFTAYGKAYEKKLVLDIYVDQWEMGIAQIHHYLFLKTCAFSVVNKTYKDITLGALLIFKM